MTKSFAGAKRLLRLALLASLVALGLATGVPAAAATSSAGETQGFQLSADTIEHLWDQNRLTASGDVELTVGDLTATGDRLEADMGLRRVLMPGPVTLKTPQGMLQGTDLDYLWSAHVGSLKSVHTVAQGFKLAGREARLQVDGFVLRDGTVTGCTLEQPDYLIAGRTIHFDPDSKTVSLQGVSLYLFGRKILPLPNLRFSLTDTEAGRLSRQRLPIPAVGYDSSRGYYLSEELPVYLSDQEIFFLGAGYGSRERGRLAASGLYTLSPATSLSLDARYVQADAVTGEPDLDGSFRLDARVGGGKVSVGYEDRDDDLGKDVVFKPSVTLAPAPVRFGVWELTPVAEGALVSEKASGQEASRVSTSLSWATRAIPVAQGELRFTGATGWARYGTGQTLLTGTANLGWERPLTSGLALLASYGMQQQAGATPFHYDLPERSYREGELGVASVSHDGRVALSAVYDLDGVDRTAAGLKALKGNLSLDSTGWKASGEVRYELAESWFSEASLSLTRHLHCFDVELKYDPLDRATSFGVSLRRL
ncbi:MAG: hypothetical protein ACM3VX_03835 [Bacteroidota bacterium]